MLFRSSFKPSKGTRSISYMGHIKMMGATQPFLSGAISKTVNLPQDASVDDIAEAYIESWRQGLKAVAIYRDNSKGTQPLNVTAQTDADKKGTRSTNAIAPVAAGSIEIEEAVIAAKAAAAQAQVEVAQVESLTLLRCDRNAAPTLMRLSTRDHYSKVSGSDSR